MTDRFEGTDEELFERLCDCVLDRGLSLSKALDAIGFPRRTFYGRIQRDEGFAKAINAIREAYAELLADELIEIADNGNGDFRRRRDQLDTRKWILSKVLPRFRDKQEIEHKGIPESLTDEERASRINAFLDAARARRVGSDSEAEAS